MKTENIVRALLLVGLVPATAADESVTRQKNFSAATTELKPIVVTASRYAETVETVPANITVITQQDIATSTARDIPSVLKKEVGLHSYDITGNGRSFRVDRSGFGETAGSNTLVLVDGRRVNNPDLSGTDWALIPLDRVARIEIVRGSRGSVLYGDNATDSVINIITKRGGEQPSLGIEGAIGSYDTQNANASFSGSHNALSYALTGRYNESDGYRDNSNTQQKDVGLSLNYLFSELASVGVSAGYHEDDTDLPGALRQSELDGGADRRDSTKTSEFADNKDYYIQLNPEIHFLENGYFKVPLSNRNRDSDFFSSFAGGEFRAETKINFTTASPQLVLQEPIAGHANTLTLGFDYYYADEDITNEVLSSGFPPSVGRFDLEKENYGAYVHNEFFLTDRLALSAGYRWDKVEYEFSPTTPGTRDGTDYDEGVATGGANFRFLERSYVYFSFAQGFRYPVLDEIFNFVDNEIDAALGPQTSDDYEVGVRHYFTSDIYGNLNFFRLDTNDEIFLDPEVGAFGKNVNLDGKTRREGVEVTSGYDSKNFSLTATYTYRDTEIRGGRFSGNQVPSVPRHQGSVDLVWRPLRDLTLALNGIHVGQRYLESDFANVFKKLDSYQVFNLKVNYKWKQYTAFLDLNNIFDEEYSAYGVRARSLTNPQEFEPAFFPSPEFNLLAGLRLNY